LPRPLAIPADAGSSADDHPPQPPRI